MQKLIIKNLGPIKNCEMEVRPFTIFIGESGSGKSILLRTIDMVKSIYHEKMKHKCLFECMKDKEIEIEGDKFINTNLHNLIQNHQLDDYFNLETSIEFLIDNLIVISIKNGKFKAKNKPISQDYPLLLNKIVFLGENRTILPEMDSVIKYTYFSDTYKSIYFTNNYDTQNKNNLLSKYTNDMFKFFDEAYNKIGNKFRVTTTNIVLNTEKLLNGEQIIIENNNKKIKFENASSGEKSSSIIEIIGYYFSEYYDLYIDFLDDVHLILRSFFLLKKLDNRNKTSSLLENGILQKVMSLSYDDNTKKMLTILIEEPESNLFPTNQRDLTYFLSSLRKMKNNPEVIFSTHSPYILMVVDSLLYAYELSQKNKDNKELQEKINQIIPKQYHLNIEDLSAYVVKNGMVESIIDPETNLINSEYIDTVSYEIMDNFNQLCELDRE